MALLEVDDLPAAAQSNELVDVMVDGANARASRVAPCLFATDPAPTADQLAEARLVLIGAVSRWAQNGSGDVQTEVVGPYSVQVDTRQRGGFNLWPSEIVQLQEICKGDEAGGVFAVDTACVGTVHAEICALTFGALYCSCAADIAGFPLYEADASGW